MARFVGGDLQQQYMARVRGVDPMRCLVVPVDVGKRSAMALVADHHGEIAVSPFEFKLDEHGVGGLLCAIEAVVAERDAAVWRVGVESAGHYHRTLVARLRSAGMEVVELNPAAVKEARSQQLLRRLKSDERDLGAMAELMIRGAGRPPQLRDEAMAAQAAWMGHRRRKVAALVALSNQVLGHLDVLFPGLDGCFNGILRTKAGIVIVRDLADPARMRRLGVEGLRRFVARRGVVLQRPKAEQLLEAARKALRLPPAERAPVQALLAADVALLCALVEEIARADDAPGGRPPRDASRCPHVLAGRRGRAGQRVWRCHRRSVALPERGSRVSGLRPRSDGVLLGWAAARWPTHQPRRIGRASLGDHRARPRPRRP